MTTQCSTRVVPIFVLAPYLTDEIQEIFFFIVGVIENFLEANVTSLQI
jgi:hypothetical protein